MTCVLLLCLVIEARSSFALAEQIGEIGQIDQIRRLLVTRN